MWTMRTVVLVAATLVATGNCGILVDLWGDLWICFRRTQSNSSRLAAEDVRRQCLRPGAVGADSEA